MKNSAKKVSIEALRKRAEEMAKKVGKFTTDQTSIILYDLKLRHEALGYQIVS